MKNPEGLNPGPMTRRDFIKGTGGGLVTPVTLALPSSLEQPGHTEHPVHFLPQAGLSQLSPNLFLLRDTCNVYVLKDGDRALLIDFGSGHVLDLLGGIGVSTIEGILHTHHHRDQCQGDERAVRARIPIRVPLHERHLFEDAENFWRNRRVFHQYEVRNDFFTITHNIPVAEVLHDYDTVQWGPYELLIYPTPGHTLGSISFIGTVDLRRVAFTGDLIHSPGKTLNLYELQYEYKSTDGADFAIFSLTRLRELGPELICPSHGEPFSNPEAGIAGLINKLKDWVRSYAPGTELTVENRPFPVTPHLIGSCQTNSSFYAIISDSGRALFVDYGSPSWNFCKEFLVGAAGDDRMRFVEHTIPELKAHYGLKSIDIAIPSHVHDDHVNGFPHLVRHYGTKIWCFENMKDVLENPRGNNLGCILPEPIRVDRVFREGEIFQWEGYEFEICHSPGHTEYQMAMFVEVDGARVAFTGDALFRDNDPPHRLRYNLIFRNWVKYDSHLHSVQTILEHQPDIIAPGHGKPFPVTDEGLKDLERRLLDQQQYFREVIADPDCNFGLDPSWVRLYPYQLQASAGVASMIELRVRNYRSRSMDLEAALVLPAGWKVIPEVLILNVPGNTEGRGIFTVTVPANWARSRSRLAIAADITVDKHYRGQIAEGVVDVRPSA
ncbi:MAG: MBL fold metallo-hydrolase [Terriglobia bacterium]